MLCVDRGFILVLSSCICWVGHDLFVSYVFPINPFSFGIDRSIAFHTLLMERESFF
jgi:hypothetical protein